MLDARVDLGTAAFEADTLLTELPRPVVKIKMHPEKLKKNQNKYKCINIDRYVYHSNTKHRRG